MDHQRPAAGEDASLLLVHRENQPTRSRVRQRRHMGFASLQVVAVGVVHGMAALPSEVRHQQQAVKHKPHQRLDTTVGVEGMMAALMGDDPAAHGHGAGDQPVEQPKGGRAGYEGDAGAEPVGQQGEGKGTAEAGPGLTGVELKQLGRQSGQQLGLART